MVENNKKLHFAVFPWLAFGHIIPYLELSKFIAQKGHKISFISTPRNIDQATIDLPYEQVKYLKLAQDDSKNPWLSFSKIQLLISYSLILFLIGFLQLLQNSTFQRVISAYSPPHI
ncbi:hypothetical protein RDI58_026061 [Solanum bulbocastanum]|uniref:Uncharacterized protein n=1 Tax=Solanum bulbocastanum TaxID=147425 RepID=A0AAN8Y0I6_SOLBU